MNENADNTTSAEITENISCASDEANKDRSISDPAVAENKDNKSVDQPPAAAKQSPEGEGVTGAHNETYNEKTAEIGRLNRRIADLTVARRNDSAINDYRRWMKEAEAVKAEFPGFDIEDEAKDARFVSLLKSGIDVRSAYTALHSEDIIAASIEKARSEIAADILRRSARPRENGISDQSAAVGKPDISSLSRSEIEAIERRVARGEKIYLK